MNAAGTRNGGNYSGVLTTTTWYRRTVTSGGCTDVSAAIQITVNPSPTATIVSGAGTFCGSTIITATGGTGGTMYFQGTTSGGTSTATPSASQTITTSGTYYFRSRSAAGCWGPEGSAVVTINVLPTGSITPTETSGIANDDGIICVGSSVTLTATAGYNSYTFKNGATVLRSTGSGNVFSTSSLAVGTYNITVDAADGNNCGATFGPVTIIVNDLPTPVLAITGTQSDNSVCPKVPVTLTAAAHAGSTYSFIINGTTGCYQRF